MDPLALSLDASDPAMRRARRRIRPLASRPLPSAPSAHRPSIAIVDDNQSVRRSLVLIMRCLGLDVHAFGSGEAFLASAAPDECQCALLDLLMPGLTGLEVLEALRARDSRLPVIVMTGDDSQGLERAASGLGAHAIVAKPFEINEIMAIVAPLCGSARPLAA